MASDPPLTALLVDPGLFTAPYDAALTRGLVAASVDARWAIRGPRPGEEPHLPPERIAPIYYRGQEASAKKAGVRAKIRKGLSHVASTRRLLALAGRENADLVHFQWSLLPAADLLAIRRLRRRGPVLLTVHDTTPFNDNPTSRLQVMGFGALLGAVDHIIVHTQRGREALVAAGCDRGRVSVIPHGALPLGATPRLRRSECDPRWTITLFGRLQPYKGVDLLIKALARIPADTLSRLRVVIAGEPMIDIAPLRSQARAAGLDGVLDWRPDWLDEQGMADLFAESDCFVFPYRRIEASGVYYQVKALGKWIVASDLGAFGEELTGETGQLVPPGDADALAHALIASVGRTPGAGAAGTDWPEIGQRTAALYRRLLQDRA